mmetsp:Transcript_4736/g.5496  ORF Transcript_4736/g.5496 Transcript_4736/m.5496 type:complete len:276 (+) Transcript_4736:146-973(+)|eukprot:CAMPEP_0204839200 /NCGR_PEP_ID=MMETSP1346-20131115/33464_1 /ASSEMBLY_ACC=CAM_ASM_000771 /TAXON_ID=215587 /ORGANISM="Aplanochytrium stocchinoi, Strain GSBS06" /LENGTH=275 /DNA_ID=CAMNT_0051975771 /DNA_START=80 /DNA_END=910 /DNA_ORIENTATION=+
MATTQDVNADSLIKNCAAALVEAKRVVVFTGAGMSADSGVATFRGQGKGIWNGIVGTLALMYFGTPIGWHWTPSFAWRQYLQKFYKPIAEAEPNYGHHALARLETIMRGKISNSEDSFSIVTMNVDGYHQRAGSTTVHEVHGTVTRHRCIKNAHPMNFEVNLSDNKTVPRCQVEGCFSSARPDCVLFTEPLPDREWRNAYGAFHQLTAGDVVVVVGTSNKVYPAAGLPEFGERMGASVYNIDIEYRNGLNNQIIGQASQVLPRIVSLVEELSLES